MKEKELQSKDIQCDRELDNKKKDPSKMHQSNFLIYIVLQPSIILGVKELIWRSKNLYHTLFLKEQCFMTI